ncbi:MAG: DUF1405 domain-containing protein [Anaerolineae bacterium]|nr:DUF1405 domain-containing protein [Anaerolineae bacterium]MDW8100310.1 DUF1405 domain-containing protein [Anaerolineae bacterium]
MHSIARVEQLVRLLQELLRRPWILAAVLAADMLGFVWGILYWYGRQLPASPIWSWPFVPDCPLFGLVGGLALLLVVAQEWTPATRRAVRSALAAIGLASLLVIGAAYAAGGRASVQGWARWAATYDSMWGLLAMLCLIAAAAWERVPNWVLSLAAMGQLKYGLWTVFAWIVFWWNTHGLFTFESVFLTVTHIAMMVQGLTLFAYYQPSHRGALAAGGWFLLSDFVDYGLGHYPRLPRQVPVSLMQWHTILVTFALTGIFWWLSGRRTWLRIPSPRLAIRASRPM